MHRPDPGFPRAFHDLDELEAGPIRRSDWLDPYPISLPCLAHVGQGKQTMALPQAGDTIRPKLEDPFQPSRVVSPAKPSAHPLENPLLLQAPEQMLQGRDLPSDQAEFADQHAAP